MIALIKKCLFTECKCLELQECCFHSLILSGPPSFFLSFFLSLFFFLPSPQWGSPLIQGKRSGYWLPPVRLHPLAPPHLFTFLCPYLEISRSPPCVECKHSHLLSRERKQGQLIPTLLILPLTVIGRGESHVRSHVSASSLLLFEFCSTGDWDCLACSPGRGSKGKRFYSWDEPWERRGWREREGGRDDDDRADGERWPVSRFRG